uniref:AlNc14C158G7712 protein n=1 Tax=Albugo laibachii Nc14 TaxID=890382 RepID=F0WMM5_9STRA|nr:AlNc14C158G7712 [Albugo laibachii Nc14]|eukprot:CCA22558.1 AlNc14C158G7712 [Albugo laibachii Nc14]
MAFFLICLSRQAYTVKAEYRLDIIKEKKALDMLNIQVHSVNTKDYSDKSKQENEKQIRNCKMKLDALHLQLDKYQHGGSKTELEQIVHKSSDYSFVNKLILTIGSILDDGGFSNYKVKKLAASRDATKLRLHVGMLRIKQNLKKVETHLGALFHHFRSTAKRTLNNMKEIHPKRKSVSEAIELAHCFGRLILIPANL